MHHEKPRLNLHPGMPPQNASCCSRHHPPQAEMVVVAVDGALPSVPPGAIPRSSRDGPAQTRRACAEVANSVARGGPPAAACCARTYVRMRGSGVMVDFSPSRRAMRHARTLGQRNARVRQEGTARPAIAHAASHTPRFYRALCADDGPWRTCALQPPPRSAISADDPVDRRVPPARSDRPRTLVTFIARNLVSDHLCTCVVQDHACTSGSLLRHSPFSKRSGTHLRDGRQFGPPRPRAVAPE